MSDDLFQKLGGLQYLKQTMEELDELDARLYLRFPLPENVKSIQWVEDVIVAKNPR